MQVAAVELLAEESVEPGPWAIIEPKLMPRSELRTIKVLEPITKLVVAKELGTALVP